jgi:hypothetical protein
MDDWDHTTARRMAMTWGHFYRKWKLDSIFSERKYPATVPVQDVLGFMDLPTSNRQHARTPLIVRVG